MGWESFDVVRFDLGPSFKVKRGETNLKVLVTRLLLVLEVWDGKTTYTRSWPGNLLVWSNLTLGPLVTLNVHFSWTFAGCLCPPEIAFSSTL